MTISFSKTIDLVFNTWAIAWSNPLDFTTKHGTSIKARSKDVMNPFICVSDPAAQLPIRLFSLKEGKSDHVIIARLLFHLVIVKTPAVDPGRSACFQTIAFK